ncbi:hypothetical protein RIF29_17862 [Crotalaria pallida]|uniref:Uncharacterized protein n=1 Tax=Crotalaria pallida TaxID=3830 RepID=A0AAN9FHV5_CROPI
MNSSNPNSHIYPLNSTFFNNTNNTLILNSIIFPHFFHFTNPTPHPTKKKLLHFHFLPYSSSSFTFRSSFTFNFLFSLLPPLSPPPPPPPQDMAKLKRTVESCEQKKKKKKKKVARLYKKEETEKKLLLLNQYIWSFCNIF